MQAGNWLTGVEHKIGIHQPHYLSIRTNMKAVTLLTLLLSAALPLSFLSQLSSPAQNSGQQTSGQSQARPFPTTNYYRSPYARPPGYRPGEYAARAYARQMEREEQQQNQQKQNQRQQGQQQQASQYGQLKQYAQVLGAPNSDKDKNKGYTYADKVNIDGMNRTFQCHLPAGYKSLKNMPVVLVFHGLQLDGLTMMYLSNFNPVSDRNGFVVIYGDGIARAWDDGRGSRSYDDVGYVCKVIEKIASTVSIDKRRVYACGISNGGYFSQLLACAIPDRLAAIGVVGSTMMQQAANRCHSNRSMPIMFFLGTGDPLVAWGSAGSGTANGELNDLVELVGANKVGGVDSAMARFGGILPVPELIDFWTAHNRCSNNPYTTMEPDRDPKDGTRVQRQSWGSSGSEVVLYRIEGGGHTWPGGFPYAGREFAGRISQDINASELLWQFFKSHSR
jgi:polyhydroxybutyrate depolymerase